MPNYGPTIHKSTVWTSVLLSLWCIQPGTYIVLRISTFSTVRKSSKITKFIVVKAKGWVFWPLIARESNGVIIFLGTFLLHQENCSNGCCSKKISEVTENASLHQDLKSLFFGKSLVKFHYLFRKKLLGMLFK